MAKVLLDKDDVYIAASKVTILGSTGNETVKVYDGVQVATDASVERVELARASSAYTYKAISTGIAVLYNGSVVANLQTGQKVAFTDGSASIASTFDPVTGAAFSLGGKAVSTDAGALSPTLSTSAGEASTINASSGGGGGSSNGGTTVTAAGSSDASTANNIYTIVAGTYTYNVAGFGPGDVLDFPAGNIPSVNNVSFTDGEVDLTWSSGGSTVTIHLTGISTANDPMLNSVANFNTVFGAGTII